MKTKDGVYRDWIEGEGLKLICKWARLGLSDQKIIEKIGIKERTFYVWQKRFPEFQKAIKEAKKVPNVEIETSMIDLACGHAYVEEIKSTIDPKTGSILKVEKFKKQIPPNATMLIFLAKNRMRDKYRDYAPVSDAEQTEEGTQQEVQIYLPDNGSGSNDS